MSIILRNISRVFNSQHYAVKNINLEISSGEIVCFLGPSGCGKTTTLRIIAGFDRPSSGSVYLLGREVAGNAWVPPEKRKIGMVFQDYALFPHLNVIENIAFGLNKQTPETRQRVKFLLELTGLEELVKRYPHQISGGQQQRVSLARALAHEPDILLLDEPFSNLDTVLRQSMREEIKRIINLTGLTSIFVTHDIQDALAVADRIIVMKEGEIQQVGKPWDIYYRPENKFVAAFLNRFALINGRISGKDHIYTDFGIIKVKHFTSENISNSVHLGIPPEAVRIDKGGNYSGRVRNMCYIGDKWEISIETEGASLNILKVHCDTNVNLPSIGERLVYDLDSSKILAFFS
ncbi:MAG: hypothetical protein JL50_05005 [Peptococcaceae bacterium BICA1-7]|nr:MAG: hypothetical protein JL50_05005 [Peptococcaceae bacterium BICA1-7]